MIEPIGETRADVRAGLICSTLANVMGGGDEPRTPADFMLFQHKPPEAEPLLEMDPEAQSNLIMSSVFGIDPKDVNT